MPETIWKTINSDDVRMIYKCQHCGNEYAMDPGEASIPYCSNEDCGNYQDETDFERVEILAETLCDSEESANENG